VAVTWAWTEEVTVTAARWWWQGLKWPFTAAAFTAAAFMNGEAMCMVSVSAELQVAGRHTAEAREAEDGEPHNLNKIY
jgi:hypothetical protein